MRYLLFLPLAVTLLVGCSKTDKELLTEGKWGIHEMKKDGETAMSLDAKEQDKIIEKTWKEQGAVLESMGMNKATVVENIKKDMAQLAKITFVFGANGKVTVSSGDGKTKDTVSPYTIDEAKKELTIQDTKTQKLTYTYTIADDKLTLKQKKDEIVFKRK
jgi:hypothetical protein